jgi:IS4 transposase
MRLLPTDWLKRTARETGAVARERKVNVVLFVWSTVLGFACSAGERSIAAARRVYESRSGDSIEESSFYNRFNPGMARLMQACFLQALENARSKGRRFQRLSAALRKFADVIITDSSVVRLHKKLEKLFPGARTNHSPAALKVHAVLNAKGSGLSVKISAGKKADVKAFSVGPWIKGKLLLFDLGYYCHNLFNRITRNGGFFLSRLKENCNPVITAVNLNHRGRSIDVVGRPLRDVVASLKRDVVDIMAKVEFKTRSYGGQQRRATAEYRVIGIRNPETKEYHLYITNIPTAMLSAEELAQLYRYRWEIELVFKEMKSYYHLEDVKSSNEHVLMVLLYATLITWVIARTLRRVIMGALPPGQRERVPARRFAAVFAQMAACLLDILTLRIGIDISATARGLKALLTEIIDPNVTRRPAMSALGC